MMKVATVWESSVPLSMILKQSGIISVWSRKLITSESSILTKAPMTPNEVNLRYSKGLPLLTVLRNGYKNNGIWAFKKSCLVSLWEATHCRSAKTLQALLEVRTSKAGGDNIGYTATISYKSADIVPTECQMKGASSVKCSLYLLNSMSALSLLSEFFSSSMCLMMSYFSSSLKLEFDYIDVPEVNLIKTRVTIFYRNYLRDGSPTSEYSSDCFCTGY